MNLGPFQPGDPIPREAAFYSACGEAAKAHQARQGRMSGGPHNEVLPLDVLVVKNNTGGNLGRGAIMGIGEPIITPTQSIEAFKSRPVFYAETPAVPDHCEKWCVLAEPLRENGVGWAYAYGQHAVQVDFAYDDQPYATIEDGTTANLVGDEGGARVLWKESGTGVKWALVQLGFLFWPTITGTLDGDLDQGSSATLNVTGGTSLSNTGRDVTVYDHSISTSKKIASGEKLTAIWRSGKWWQEVPGDCEVDQ